MARVVREDVTSMEGPHEMMSSVAPTLQCAGKTGIAYAKTSLYDEVDVGVNTIELGGYDVKDDSVCVCVTLPPERWYNDRWKDSDSVTSRSP